MSYSRQQAQWMPMYQQNPADEHGVYKPTGVSQNLEVDSDGVPTYRKQTWNQKHFGGTKRTLRAFAITAVIVLGVNVGWLGVAKSKYGIVDGYGIIETGECESVKSLNTWFHFLINVLSTLLLTASNAFMAAYSGPTRQEIDKAHARRKWLHVGSVSFRNLTGISWSKSLVVLVLAISSVPFHLLYNSLVYTELSANEYYWTVATEGFLLRDAFNLTAASMGWYTWDSDSVTNYYTHIQESATSWERLDQKSCIQAYSNAFLSERRNVVLVSSTQNSTNSVLYYGFADLAPGSDFTNNWWICSLEGNDGGNQKCNSLDYLSKASSWKVFNYPIEYCLSERVETECSVKFNLQIMLIVVSFNALKVLAMIWVLICYDAQALITCVGDAAASFIRHADQTTLGMCLADRRQIMSYWLTPGPRAYNGGGRRHWGAAISRHRWIMFTLLMLFSWCVVFFWGVWGFAHTKSQGVALTPSGLAEMGFGAINQHALAFAGASDAAKLSPISLSIIANIPQVFLALIYLMYMGVMSAMFNAVDWARFARTPQTLMVSSPAGQQRGTWLLGAPIWYGLALVTLQILLHWFVSQSIFVVQLNILDQFGNTISELGRQQNIGYSPIAIICTVVASGILYLSAIVFMMRRVPLGSPPVVSTCSAAISAACHVPREMMSDAVVYEKLGWGATGDSPSGIGHCSLGPATVFVAGIGYAGTPIMGKGYAGSEVVDGRSRKDR